MKRILFPLINLLFLTLSVSAQKQIRVKEDFDFDWKFSKSDNKDYAQSDYPDAQWEDIQLPHDWNRYDEFDRKVGGSSGFTPGGIAWYRKTFKIPVSYKNKIVTVLFDGIFHQSDVYINGEHLGFRPYGFCSIEYDLTPYLNLGGENTIAVRVNCTGDRPRWYAGAGIYRHAWLQITNPVRVETYGTYITTPKVSEDQAAVDIVTTIANSDREEQTVTVLQRILDASGKQVAKSGNEKINIRAGEKADVKQNMLVNTPHLWDIESPTLYTMETTVKTGSKVADVYHTTFGIRTIAFDKDKGFFLNDNHVKLKGVCLHFDGGNLGTAVPNRSNERKLEILKEYGVNAIRAGHHQPPTEFLDMCDRMGFVFIDEAFDKWKSGYYEKYFDEWWQCDIADMILRDRNHPSVILWSIGNELQEAWDDTDTGVERARMLRDFVKKMEPSRLTMLAAQNGHQAKFAGVTDVTGYNYLEARMIGERAKYPDRIVLVSEELPYFRGEEGRIRSYTPLNPWELVESNDFVAGGFIWSGVDYLGEAANWPSKGWPNGLFDICMFEKPRAAYHRAKWNPEPMVRIAVMDQSLDIDHGRDLWQWPKMVAHWNFPRNYEGLIMEIRTTTNCESVEMYLNDKLMGKQHTKDFTNNTIVWYLPYTPGKLQAKAYNGEKQVATYQLVTSKETSKAVVKADQSQIKADGQDLSHITISLLDEDGNLVQTDNRKITVTIKGEGRFLGMDNGDLRREKSWAGNELNTYFGKALVVVQSTRKSGIMFVHIKVDGIDEEYKVEIESKL
ncbi:sugar-binding domain-containing protein [Bacteroides sp. 51]|uniref:sugar-binding domain-containing protein n=1 Tax=Bacteroides sp. 51 TaxID=2302938 RepID=UPI0013D6ACF8|nr:sugar-binding domain-containing protein [Bacteroides sp. 51]NDV81612.1 DUF4982 domain-containing protein [Bacteroides sp. 51]